MSVYIMGSIIMSRIEWYAGKKVLSCVWMGIAYGCLALKVTTL